MNYLTNYYKNLCEQLQEKVNQLQKQIEEAYVLDPNQKFAASMKPYGSEPGPVDSRESRLKQGRRRADILGQMLAAQSYDSVNDDERAAIARIVADTQSSAPRRETVAYGNFRSYGPSAKQSGTEASGQDLRVALGAVKRLGQDPKFAQHVTQTFAAKLPDTVMDRAHTAELYADRDFPSFGSREQKILANVSTQHAKNLTASSRPSAVTSEFGERMFDTFPADRDSNELGPDEYSSFVPMDIVSNMLKRKK